MMRFSRSTSATLMRSPPPLRPATKRCGRGASPWRRIGRCRWPLCPEARRSNRSPRAISNSPFGQSAATAFCSTVCGSELFALAQRWDALAQLALQDLAEGRARKIRDDDDALGRLLDRDAFAAEMLA